MTFNWFDLIVMFGVLQGLLSAGLLFKNKTASKKLLAGVLLIFSLLSFKIALHTLRLWDIGVIRYFPLAIDLIIQPLLYLYVTSLIRPGFNLNRKLLVYFVPALLFIIHASIVYIAVLPEDNLQAKDIIAEKWHYNTVKDIEDYLSVISAMIYGVLSFRLIKSYRRWLYLNISDTNYLTFAWLKNVLVCTGILGLWLTINIIIDQIFHFGGRHFLHWQLFYIYLSVLIYYIAFHGYQQPESAIIGNKENDFSVEYLVIPSKYTPQELEAAKSAIIYALQESKLFLNGELTLNLLADHIKLSPAVVSVAINKEFGKTFRTLINDYRIEKVKLMLLDTDYTHLSILGIALECGFNSEASFYRIFKTATGVSPKVYLDQIKQDSVNAQPKPF